MSISDVLFEMFWIITGISANIVVLILSFVIFVFAWCCLKRIIRADKESE